MPNIDSDRLEQWIIDTIKSEESQCGAISIIFCSDDYLLDVNREHLDHDYYTDIITFQYEDQPVSGDLFISVDRVRDNASKIEVDMMRELHRVIIHGVLHLVGYGDKTDDEAHLMRNKEDYYLESLSNL